MRTRLELQSKLEEVLESRQVYYQPPSTADFSTTDKYGKGGFYLLELARLLKNEKIRFDCHF